ncbi:hypothetical protein HMSSN036_07860 [Paenibacillus macerans]|nr:hypothetical protein HMSSN036_07860 [Paenibacillus macerans]
MVILHCLQQTTWEEVKDRLYYGKQSIERDGFIHCSSIETFWRVAPNFKDMHEPLLLLCIDTAKVEAPIKWEDNGNYGQVYPHIYGELNLSAVIKVLPFLRDEQGDFVLNEELKNYLQP